MIFKREPVVIIGLVQAALALAIGFGLHLTVEQNGLILAFTAAVLAVIARTQVTPNGSVPQPAAAADIISTLRSNVAEFTQKMQEVDDIKSALRSVAGDVVGPTPPAPAAEPVAAPAAAPAPAVAAPADGVAPVTGG